MLRALGCVAFFAVAGGCTTIPTDPLLLDGNLLIVENQTDSEWSDVEIWLNRQFRVTARSIPPKGLFRVPLDVFVAGYGQRFDLKRMQVHDLRLTAKRDGAPFELVKDFTESGLAGALGGKR